MPRRAKKRPPECEGCPLHPDHPKHDPRYHGNFVAPHCTCDAHQNAEFLEFFDLNPDDHCTAKVLAIGMAPGPEEERAGEPLVGPAGRRWKAAEGWAIDQLGALKSLRLDVKKMNLVQCRTQQPGLSRAIVNRDPTTPEIRECAKRFLTPTLKASPSDLVILPLGQLVAKHLFPHDIRYNETVNSRVKFSVADVLRTLTGSDD